MRRLGVLGFEIFVGAIPGSGVIICILTGAVIVGHLNTSTEARLKMDLCSRIRRQVFRPPF